MCSAYLSKIDEAVMKGVKVGIDIGMQMACDFITLSMRDPKVTGKDTFSGKRLAPIMNDALGNKREQYAPAWGGGPEADYYQAKLDANLKECYEEAFEPFPARYPHYKKNRYLPKGYKGGKRR